MTEIMNRLNLVQIFTARESWQRLAALKLPPLLGYRLLKYMKKVLAEIEIIEMQRVKLIRDCAGVKEGMDAELVPGTPGHARFVAEFGTLLNQQSDLEPSNTKFDDLIGAISTDGNALSVQDLAQLEPFFETKGAS